MLLVCNPAGKVQAVTSTAISDCFPGASVAERDFGEIVGLGPAINLWFKDRMREAVDTDEYSAEAILENEGERVLVRLESLRRDGELYGFVLQFFPVVDPEVPHAINDGDSIISRRQWHEIKNHVGALKLYATFLKRQMPEGDERRIVEKIFNGVNALIGYLDKIRRGEPQ
jgi:hypothetical protein